jgi:hypothetical protein
MTRSGAALLAGAGSRLLPPSIPFRFFGAAVLFHAVAWPLLFAGANEAPSFAGGLGLPLAALHAITLGVLAMTAIGASLQLLPVATRAPVGSARTCAAIFALYATGVAGLLAGIAASLPALLFAAAGVVAATLAAYAALLARNLLAARGMPIVVAHGWSALVSLIATLASGFALASAYAGVPLLERTSAIGLHVVFAAYGFMGMLVLGFSYILLPMFALAEAPARRPSAIATAFAIAALIAAAPGIWSGASPFARPTAAIAGLFALALHVRLMRSVLASGLRRALGRSFMLVYLGWGMLGASLVAALALALDAPWLRLPFLLGALAIGGLLSFLLGVLARIVPFLASMHAAQGRQKGAPLPPTPSALTAERPLAIHFACHVAALALLVVAVIFDAAALAAAGAAVGTVGAIAYAWFFAAAWRGMLRAVAAGRTPRAPASGVLR